MTPPSPLQTSHRSHGRSATTATARQQQQQPHRYRKGMIMVGLLLISESNTVVNAISFWNQFLPKPRHQQHSSSSSATSQSHDTPPTNTVCRSSSSSSRHSNDDECLPPGPPTFLYALAQLFAFPTTMDTTTTKKKKKIAAVPRGGALVVPDPNANNMTPYQMPLCFWKLVFQSVLTLINVICWYVPLQLHARQQRKAAAALISSKVHPEDNATTTTTTTQMSLHQNNNNNGDITETNQFYMSIANAFSGGVFLSLAFGHLIPECVHGFSQNDNGDHPNTQPYWFVLSGYLLIFVVEKVAFSETHELLSHHAPPSHSNNHNHEPPSPSHSYRQNGDSSVSLLAAAVDPSKSTVSSVSLSSVSPPTHHSPPTSTTTTPLATGRSALILLGALGVHSILEMMALGLADTFRDCALLTISISLHQPAESIALLVAFIKSGLTHTQIIVFLSIFSSMGMIGVLLGMMVNEYAAPIVDSIMLAIVAGTFVYVGATEIIPEEFESSQYKWKKFLAFLSGIVTILCITQYTATLGGH